MKGIFLIKLIHRINNLDDGEKLEISMDEDEFLEDIGQALDFAVADMLTLQNVIDDVDGVINK